MITYKKAWDGMGSIGDYNVYLDGKRVGTIHYSGSLPDKGKPAEGWRYFPLNKKTGGEIFGSLIECKQSLEGGS